MHRGFQLKRDSIKPLRGTPVWCKKLRFKISGNRKSTLHFLIRELFLVDWIQCLSSTVQDDENGKRTKTWKTWPTFSSLDATRVPKIPQYLFYLEKFIWYSLSRLQWMLLLSNQETSYDQQPAMTKTHQNYHDSAPSTVMILCLAFYLHRVSCQRLWIWSPRFVVLT